MLAAPSPPRMGSAPQQSLARAGHLPGTSGPHLPATATSGDQGARARPGGSLYRNWWRSWWPALCAATATACMSRRYRSFRRTNRSASGDKLSSIAGRDEWRAKPELWLRHEATASMTNAQRERPSLSSVAVAKIRTWHTRSGQPSTTPARGTVSQKSSCVV